MFGGIKKVRIFAARLRKRHRSLKILEEQVQASTENKIDRER